VSGFRAQDRGFSDFMQVVRAYSNPFNPSKIQKPSYIRKMEETKEHLHLQKEAATCRPPILEPFGTQHQKTLQSFIKILNLIFKHQLIDSGI
jgi:hypothetical protein